MNLSINSCAFFVGFDAIESPEKWSYEKTALMIASNLKRNSRNLNVFVLTVKSNMCGRCGSNSHHVGYQV